MVLYYKLNVFKEVYQLILKIYEYTKDFPREYKYSLGQDMKHAPWYLFVVIYRANKTRDKRGHLEVFLDNFEILKLRVRLTYFEDLVLWKIRRRFISCSFRS